MRLATISCLLALVLLPASAEAKWHSAVPLPPTWPTIFHEDCPGTGLEPGCAAMGDGSYSGCTDTAGCVWLSPGPDRYTRMHELGHIFDFQVLTDRDRERLTQIMGLRAGPWLRTSIDKSDGSLTVSDRSPNEWFADAYAHCAMKLDGRVHHGVLVGVSSYYSPSPHEYDVLCAAIRYVAL